MQRTLLLTLVLSLALAAALFAAPASPSQPAVTVPATPPAHLVPEATGDSTPAVTLPDPLAGAHFLSDPDCESACQEEYLQCALGCAACDQCSCQYAYCRVNCGVPFQGC